jgi:gamma-glutamylcyclotransferase
MSRSVKGKGAMKGALPRPMRQPIVAMRRRLRRFVARSWLLSRLYYRLHGARLAGWPAEEIWYFAYGANMHDRAFRIRRGIRAVECRVGRVEGFRLRFNLEGRPRGRSAPANLCRDPDAEVWGVLYRITRRDLLRLDSTEGVPGRGYRHAEIEAQDADGRLLRAVAYMAPGAEIDGKPSLRYITLLRDGARAHGLPEHYVRYLDSVEHAR